MTTGTSLLVGVDVGGTKVAVRAQAWNGEVVADRVLPAAGWRVEPAHQAAAWLLDRIHEALPPESRVAAAAVGAQRCDTDERARLLEGALGDLGVPATVSAVGKVRGFFAATSALVCEADVAMPRVETGAEGDCDPPVTPTPSEEASDALGKA